eukprot:jgi/Bigna1/75379/fgenesh1_pg.34_\
MTSYPWLVTDSAKILISLCLIMHGIYLLRTSYKAKDILRLRWGTVGIATLEAFWFGFAHKPGPTSWRAFLILGSLTMVALNFWGMFLVRMVVRAYTSTVNMSPTEPLGGRVLTSCTHSMYMAFVPYSIAIVGVLITEKMVWSSIRHWWNAFATAFLGVYYQFTMSRLLVLIEKINSSSVYLGNNTRVDEERKFTIKRQHETLENLKPMQPVDVLVMGASTRKAKQSPVDLGISMVKKSPVIEGSSNTISHHKRMEKAKAKIKQLMRLSVALSVPAAVLFGLAAWSQACRPRGPSYAKLYQKDVREYNIFQDVNCYLTLVVTGYYQLYSRKSSR